jgi:ADP-ribosylglycohydrolase
MIGGESLSIDEKIRDKIRGSFFGAAIGDALGAAVEFKTKAEIERLYPGGLRRFDQIHPGDFCRSWQVGEWTDDTEQALCVAQTLMACGKIEPVQLAKRLLYWLETDGRGCGRHTHLVLTHLNFSADPEAAAAEVWRMENESSNAANGALMRAFPTGLWDFWDAQAVAGNAGRACLTTHADRRCVNSCLIYTLIISRILMEPDKIDALKPEEGMLAGIAKKMDLDDVDLQEAVTYRTDIRGLKLETKIGYTYRALSAAVWALYRETSVEQGIATIINQGGDADSNGIVAGALLGARYGFESIPHHLVDGLVHRDLLQSNVDQFLAKMEPRYNARVAGNDLERQRD